MLPHGGGPDGRSPVSVAEGTTCMYSLHSMHRRKDLFGDDADEFRPDRWGYLWTDFDYLPFSGGPRACPGQQLALAQISLTLFRVLQMFSFVEPRDDDEMLLSLGTTARFADGCWVGMRSPA